jgi:hypothetical protein
MTISISAAPAATDCLISSIFDGHRHQVMIDADGADRQVEAAHAERVDDIGAHRLAGLGAQPAHGAGGVVAGQGGQIDATDRAQQPGRLPIFLHRAPCTERGGTALDRAAIDMHCLHCSQVERHAGVARIRRQGGGRML